MALPDRVLIREVGPREGFQTLSRIIPTERKIALINALSATGVKAIEVASFVRPDRLPTMADAEEVVAGFDRVDNVRYTALYLNLHGFERGEALNDRLDNQGWISFAVSERFLKRNNNTTVDALVETIPDWVAAFGNAGKSVHGLMVSTAFGTNYEGPIDSDRVLPVLARVIEKIDEAGDSVEEICLADTMGWATPDMLRRLIGAVRERFPGPEISLHLHDTRGLGVANVYAGLLEGVRIIDASVGGLGGCPFAEGAAGNVCTEDVAFLCQELGIETGIDLPAYVEAARLAEDIVGFQLPGSFYRAVPQPSPRVTTPAQGDS